MDVDLDSHVWRCTMCNALATRRYTPVSRRNGNGGVLSHSDSDDSEYGGGSRSPNPHSSRAALRNRGSSDQAQGDLELMDMQLPDVDDV